MTYYYSSKRLIRNKPKEKHFYITYKKMQKLFKQFNIKYVANGGTLIGAVRDGKMIAWDDDMDFCTDYKNKDILFSNEFKQEAKKINLDIGYYENPIFWGGGIGGLKISDKGSWEKGQIDMFFFSNAVNEDIYYIGNDGHPHYWEDETYKKDNIYPLRFFDFQFPTISKCVKVPCPNKYDEELSRQWGDYLHPPSNIKEYFLYKIDKIIYK